MSVLMRSIKKGIRGCGSGRYRTAEQVTGADVGWLLE